MGEIVLKITEKDIATQTGMTRETVSRMLKLLKDSHILTVERGVLRIRNIDKLEEALEV